MLSNISIKTFSIYLLILLSHSLLSQEDAYFVKNANTYIADTSYWTAYSNPASLGFIQNSSYSIGINNYHSLKELNSISLQTIQNINNTTIGFGINNYGTVFYSTMGTSIALSKKIHEKISIGTVFNNYLISGKSKFSNTHYYNISLGCIYNPEKNLFIGLKLTHNEYISYKKNKRLSSDFGLKYLFAEKFSSQIQFTNDIYDKMNIRISLQSQINEHINIGGGLSNNQNNIYLGTEIIISEIKFNLAVSNNIYLGKSFYFSAIKQFNKKETTKK